MNLNWQNFRLGDSSLFQLEFDRMSKNDLCVANASLEVKDLKEARSPGPDSQGEGFAITL